MLKTGFALMAMVFLCPNLSLAQVHIPHYNTTLTSNVRGYYSYTPAGYDPAGDKTYPLMIFLHGYGERGNGNPGQLGRVLNHGVPKLIEAGEFPAIFTSGGKSFSFIVISPQFVNWPGPADVNAVLNMALANYKVDPDRIYVTGSSMGGGATWEFAGTPAYSEKIAAIVPVAGASTPENSYAHTIAAANIAVWATHNSGDQTVTVSNTHGYIDRINNAPVPPTVPARKTIFQVSGHDAWTRTYDPSFTENGMNIYQWMLQYERNASILPVKLTEYRVFKSAAKQATLEWKTAEESNNHHFTIERSSDGANFSAIGTIPAAASAGNYSFVDHNPFNGINYYRLSQTDIDGTVKHFNILKLNFADAGNSKMLLIPNPANAFAQLSFEDDEIGPFVIRLYNMAGHTIRQWRINKTHYNWAMPVNLASVPAGTYIIEVKGKTFKATERLIKN